MSKIYETIRKAIGWPLWLMNLGISTFIANAERSLIFISEKMNFDLKSVQFFFGAPRWSIFVIVFLSVTLFLVAKYASKATDRNFISLKTAFDIISKSKFGWETISTGKEIGTEVRSEIRRACLENGLILYGAKKNSVHSSYILRDEWNFSYLSSSDFNEREELLTVIKSGHSISDLSVKRITGVERGCIERIWPKPFFLYPVYVSIKLWAKKHLLRDKHSKPN